MLRTASKESRLRCCVSEGIAEIGVWGWVVGCYILVLPLWMASVLRIALRDSQVGRRISDGTVEIRVLGMCGGVLNFRVAPSGGVGAWDRFRGVPFGVWVMGC